MGKSAISMAIFNSKLLVYQRLMALSKKHQRGGSLGPGEVHWVHRDIEIMHLGAGLFLGKRWSVDSVERCFLICVDINVD